jgi:hypothetical protein
MAEQVTAYPLRNDDAGPVERMGERLDDCATGT